MPCTPVTRRTQFSSCDGCRRSRVACDASAPGVPPGSGSCTRCRNRRRPCTFKWLEDAKGGASNRASRRGRRRQTSLSSTGTSSIQGSNGAEITVQPCPTGSSPHDSDRHTPQESMTAPAWNSNSPAFVPPSPAYSISTPHYTSVLGDADSEWLRALYRGGFEAVFGSWMGSNSCPFLFGQDRLAQKYVSISDLCRHLDQTMAESSISKESEHREIKQDYKAENSMQSTIAAFAARWLPIITSSTMAPGFDHLAVTQTLWRHARRDMLRIIHRPSYRSMLSLLLFALTPIPSGISAEEEADGISGQACLTTALQQIQTLRARQRNLKFSGSKVSLSLENTVLSPTPDAMDTSGFINAESIVYWAALTFDTSASLTLDCRPLLSSGLFGFESEVPWQLVRTCSKVFHETSEQWRRDNAEMTDDRANQIIAAGASWKLLGWKLTAIFKEAVRDGHNESEVRRAFVAVLDSIREFNTIYRPQLNECHNRLQFLGQRTKLRWFSLMLHYHLSILMLIDVCEVTDRHDLLADLAEVISDAETTVMNTLAYGLHTTMILKREPDMDSALGGSVGGEPLITVPMVSIDPYPHHVVAGVQLMRKAIDRDFRAGKVAPETRQSLLSTLERTLSHLPQCSKSVQAARAEFTSATLG